MKMRVMNARDEDTLIKFLYLGYPYLINSEQI